MAADHFGHGVDDQARTVLDRAADQGGEGIVDDQGDAGFARDLRQEIQLGKAEQGIRQGLGEDELRRRLQQRPERTEVRRVEHVMTDPPPRELAGHERGRFAIDAVGNEEVVILTQECEKNRGDRSHARSTDQAGLSSLESGQLVGELGRVGVCLAGINEARDVSLVEGIDVVETSSGSRPNSARSAGPEAGSSIREGPRRGADGRRIWPGTSRW